MSWGTLRKYQYCFKINIEDLGANEHIREAVVAAVEKHFSEDLKIDHSKLIMKFLKIKKEDKNDQNYNLRKGRAARGQGNLGLESMGNY